MERPKPNVTPQLDLARCWVSHPAEWQEALATWATASETAVQHEWTQYGGSRVCGITLGRVGPERPVRLLAAVPHAHEPAPTTALVNLASVLLRGCFVDGTPVSAAKEVLPISEALLQTVRERFLLTLLPDTNSQGRMGSPRRVWDGELSNDEFLKVAFGEAADGERFGRYPEWSWSVHRARKAGVVYESLDEECWVEPNTSRRSTHTRAVDELFQQYQYTHHLDLHQHEGDEATLFPADFHDLPPEAHTEIAAWGGAVRGAWEAAGIRHKGGYVPYLGLPRQQFFRDYWTGRCPGMLRLTTETRNNRHITTDEPTPLERQFRSAWIALTATLEFLASDRPRD
jgi:hypothetical protein